VGCFLWPRHLDPAGGKAYNGSAGFHCHQDVSMLPHTRTIVSPKKFDELLKEEAKIAEFSSPAEETAYEKRDAFLIYLIQQLVAEHFAAADKKPHILEDWWPDHTRFLDMALVQYTEPFVIALHGLLTDEFADYRIQICVYDDPLESKTYIGSLALYADRLVIEKALDKRVRLS
jgi:hypothetical protein